MFMKERATEALFCFFLHMHVENCYIYLLFIILKFTILFFFEIKNTAIQEFENN